MPLAELDERWIVRAAFAERKLAADDIVARFLVAVNLDSLDVNSRPLLNMVGEVDDGLACHPLDFGSDGREWLAAPCEFHKDGLSRLVDRFRIVDVATAGYEQ